jgi:hypothetical protein
MGSCMGKVTKTNARRQAADSLECTLLSAHQELERMCPAATTNRAMPLHLRNCIRRWRQGERPMRDGVTWVDERLLLRLESAYASNDIKMLSPSPTTLPLYDALVVHTLGMLDATQLEVCRRVCRAWRKACEAPSMWRTLPVVVHQDLWYALAGDSEREVYASLAWTIRYARSLHLESAYWHPKHEHPIEPFPTNGWQRLLAQPGRLARLREVRVRLVGAWLCDQLASGAFASLDTFVWIDFADDVHNGPDARQAMVARVSSHLPAATLTSLHLPFFVPADERRPCAIASQLQRLVQLEHLSLPCCSPTHWNNSLSLASLTRLTSLEVRFLWLDAFGDEMARIVSTLGIHAPLVRLTLLLVATPLRFDAPAEMAYCETLKSVDALAHALDALVVLRANTNLAPLTVHIVKQHVPRRRCHCPSPVAWSVPLVAACSVRARGLLECSQT